MTALATRPVTHTPSIADQVRTIETEMHLASQAPSLDSVLRVEERFQQLRARALRENRAMAPHIEQLKALRTRLEQLKAPLANQLVDELHRLRTSIQAAEAREAALREAVIWLSRFCGRDELRGTTGAASVRHTVRHSLPATGSPARERLEALVRENHLWDAVSMIQGPRLTKAIEAGRFAGAALAEVNALCPATTTYSVRTFDRL